MGTVIEFPADRVAPAEDGRRRRADVVIFPGVRVERREFSLADRVTPRRKSLLSSTQEAEPG
jgi:hypothetical protein